MPRPLSENKIYVKMSVFRGVQLALRRTIASVAASRIGMALGTDVHHTSVTTWEIKTAASLISCSQEFHYVAKHLLQSLGAHVEMLEPNVQHFNRPNPFAKWMNFLIRCDALSSPVWQHKVKMHGLAVVTHVNMNHKVNIYCHTMHADLLPVYWSDAESLLLLMKKQISQAGAPLWTDVSEDNVIAGYTACTDAGGDAKKSRLVKIH